MINKMPPRVNVLPVSPRPIPSPLPIKTTDILLSHAILQVVITDKKRWVEEKAHQNAKEEEEEEEEEHIEHKKEVSYL